MRNFSRNLYLFVAVGLLALSLSACGSGGGGSPARYDPGAVGVPSGVTITAGNTEVALSWNVVANAASYKVYWSTSTTVDKANSSSLSTKDTSARITGLVNGTTYYFAVTSVVAYAETEMSAIVQATPAASDMSLIDLDGTWNFNILVSGGSPGWMQGQISISSGVVTFTSFLDSSGGTVAPNDLFATWSVYPDGTVSQTGSATSFSGALSRNTYKDILVSTASWRGNSTLIAVLQKQVDSVAFGNADIQGSGGAAGPKFFVYNQISSGPAQEWEFAVGKLGAAHDVKYMAFDSSDHTTSTFPTIPTFSSTVPNAITTSTLSIDSTGVVTENAMSGTTLAPAVYFRGRMSADKTLIVGTFTQGTKYVLRIYQIINPLSGDYVTPPIYDLSKPCNVQKLTVGPTVFSAAHGTMALNAATSASGTISFSSYEDGLGGTLPAEWYYAYTAITWNSNKAISADLGAILTDPGSSLYPAILAFYGKVSRHSYLIAWTRTESDGSRSLTIGMQKPQ